MQAKDHHHRTDRRTRDKEASEAPHQLRSLTPNYPEFLQRYSDAHDDATFKAELARIIEGLPARRGSRIATPNRIE